MNTCRTCKHCAIKGDENFCRKIEDPNNRITWLSGAEEGLDSLYMDPDKFGCILHEPVEQTSPDRKQ